MADQKIDPRTVPMNRFKVQVYLCDMDATNPVGEAYAIGCPDRESAQLLYDSVQRVLQVLTYKAIDNG